jgi:GT2 family glycosyltransferase
VVTPFAQDISVVICAYTEDRWDDLVAAVASVQGQSESPREIVVVVDHNSALIEHVRLQIPGVVVVENREPRGLSGARNSGVAAAQGAIIAFLDDDAITAPDWLERLTAGYKDPQVLGIGGCIEPMWLDQRPEWFPKEFDWVVGCTYRGMPEATAPVRNLIGCNMSFRREVFEGVGGFRDGIGRVGTRPVGCEETELCIRVSQRWPQSVLLYEPAARVYHRVPKSRARWGYFRSRCYAEGLSKALVSRLVGAGDGLASERIYTFRTLPLGVVQGVKDAFLGRDAMGITRAGSIVAGLAFTTMGYLMGTVSDRFAAARQQIQSKMPTPEHKDIRSASEAFGFDPVRILEVEIGQPLPDVSAFEVETGKSYRRAMSLVRLHKQPLGVVEFGLTEDGISAGDYARQIWGALGSEINRHLRRDGLPDEDGLGGFGISDASLPICEQERTILLNHAPTVSIVVATRDRPDSLSVALDSLLSLDDVDYEIIVVDNAPSNDVTSDLVQKKYGDLAQVHYVREDRPGLAVAHNRGYAQARGEIVAFTDDDVIVDEQWLVGIVAGFAAAENVACVTGLILPAEIETPAQVWIEQFGGFSKGFTRCIFDLDTNRPSTPLYPYAAGMFGSGANMAFKKSVLREIGGFDPALGAGSKGVGGDDLAAFFEVVSRGYTLVYEPAAIVHHFHRRDYAGLRKQAYGYGVGLTAYLMKTLVDKPYRILDIAGKVPHGLIHVLSSRSPKNRKKLAGYPQELTSAERKGMLFGPFAYLCGRLQSKGRAQPSGPLEDHTMISSSPAPIADEVRQL